MIKMVNICDESIAYPLKIIFETASKSGIFPNIVPMHKKESKNIIKNYRPISILPVCSKIFEKCSYFIILFTLILHLIIFYLNFSQVFIKVTLVYHITATGNNS